MTPQSTNDYRPRIADSELQESLDASAAVLIEGPRACGKTATARKAAVSEVFFDADSSRAAASLDPEQVLRGATPRLLDEWQLVPEIWNHVRRAAEHSVSINTHRPSRAPHLGVAASR